MGAVPARCGQATATLLARLPARPREPPGLAVGFLVLKPSRQPCRGHSPDATWRGGPRPGRPHTLTWLTRGWSPEDMQVSQAWQAGLLARTRPSQLQSWHPAWRPRTPRPRNAALTGGSGAAAPPAPQLRPPLRRRTGPKCLVPRAQAQLRPRALAGGLLKRPPALLPHFARSAACRNRWVGGLCLVRGDRGGLQSSVMPGDAAPPQDVPTVTCLRHVLPRGSSPPRPPVHAVVRPDT